MKIKWSAFFYLTLLLALASCGKEQFGSTPQSSTSQPSGLTAFSHNSCSAYTLIKPKVDVLYVVDNSSSSYYIPSQIKDLIKNTVNSLSQDFDYRVVGTPLIETPTGNQDYQVMTNSADLTGIPSDSRRIHSANSFTFFQNVPGTNTAEKGLGRTISFINHHKNALFRNGAYLVTVLISNGRDVEVEEQIHINGETTINQANYDARLNSFRSLKTQLNSQQLRLFSVTAKTNCQSGWLSSMKSYVKMAQQLYIDSGAQDNNTLKDSYDLCGGGLASVFGAVNSSIQQVTIPHSYRYWPITFANSGQNVDFNQLKVYKVSSNGTSVQLPINTSWTYQDFGSSTSVNTRELPTVGEPIVGRHFVRFTNGNLITYPDCVLIQSVSKTEYFGYIVLPQKPKLTSPEPTVWINGQLIPQSATNGWSYVTASPVTINIKVPHPSPGDENPPIMRTGFMLKLNGSNNYYKSGDNVQVNYIPDGI